MRKEHNEKDKIDLINIKGRGVKNWKLHWMGNTIIVIENAKYPRSG